MKNMTAFQLDKICKANRYVLLRLPDGNLMAINCKCAEIAKRKNGFDGNKETVFVSYRACNFNEYISHKPPF